MNTPSGERGPRATRRRRPRPERLAPKARVIAASPTPRASRLTCALAVLRTEIIGLARDRRALFSAFVLPTLLYPFLFLSNSWLQKISKETLDSRSVRVALDLVALPDGEAQRLRELLAQETPITLVEIDATPLLALGTNLETGATVSSEERARVEKFVPSAGDALIIARKLSGAPHVALRTYFDGQTDIGNETARRTNHAIAALRDEFSARRVNEILGEDPARGLDAKAVDVATEAQLSGATLGRFLPLVLVMVLLAGASYAALAAFAGERESGTLETLLVQPVDTTAIVGGKFAAVLLVGIVTIVLNAGSVLVSLQMGLGSLPGTQLGSSLILDGGRLLGAALLFLPAAVFLCAILCLLCGRARTFREGQQLLLPLLFVSILPILPSTQSDISLDPLLAAIPLCGPSIALRDVLRGEFSVPLLAWMFAAQCGWAALALSRLSRLLDAEKVVQGASNEAEDAARNTQSRVAIRWATVTVFAVYLIGATLQKWNIAWGLAATLWLLVLPLALLSARGTAQRARESVRQALWLNGARPLHLLGAVLIAPGLVFVSTQLFEWQQRVLPMPSIQGDVQLFQGDPRDHTLATLLLVALSPAICEELFFRGALLSGLRRDLAAWKIVAYEMFFFGAVHMSIYRFAPTAVMGGVLACITLRSKSILPAMIVHATYNGLLVLQQEDPTRFAPAWAWLGVVGLALFGLGATRERSRGI